MLLFTVWKLSCVGILCSTTKFRQIYAISDVFKCDERHYEVIEIELWKRNIKQYKSAAKSLLVKEKICNTYKSFGGWRSTVKKSLPLKWYSDDRYKTRMNKGTCEDEEGMEIFKSAIVKELSLRTSADGTSRFNNFIMFLENDKIYLV